MIDSDFRRQIRDMSNFTPAQELPEFAEGVEYTAKEIIAAMDEELRRKTAKSLEENSMIIHVRENNYNGRKVIQFQARTARM